ncbi:glycoside hydrolase [Mesorhizobium sp. Root695]|uniref:glycoside hydrolase family 25 protein n=1 Tax=unclassified Mesorhizobium TaxID=325217 RepID=UPI0006F8CFC2|nr:MULTISPECIES: GH25 family lysozyme [unclassified Mesorhizobium]KQU98074.1 glycoside hydrolase [Mesorhizobium sp. Root102]KRB33095.1 glycoside hydrolase [Mesorhizobium sp. Root695]
MRRFAGLIMLTLLGACSTVDDLSPLSPSASSSPTVAVRAPRFEDSKPHEWDSGAPWNYAVHGTDVSKYQTSVDWPAARASGISFAFIKATEGGDRFDEYFNEHWARTKANGIPRAAYHFYYFCTPAAVQARWFIRNVPVDRSAMPPVLDMEWNPQSPTCKLRPDAATVRAEMSTFLEIVERHYGKKPIIYTSVDFFDDNELSSFRGYPYWLRSVAGHPREKYGSHPFTFWQYTGTGIIPGMPGKADINVFNGSEAAWNKWLRQNTR